jgi:hypothetical protein
VSTQVTDLVGDVGFVVRLLDGHLDWRQRLVRELVFASTTAEVRMTSTYEVRFPSSLRKWGTIQLTDDVRMVLPLGARPKELLLRLDVTGPAGSAANMVMRGEGSRYQAAYLSAMLDLCESGPAIRAGLVHARPHDLDKRDDVWIAELLGAVCKATPQLAKEYGKQSETRRGYDGVANFLANRARIAPDVTEDHVRGWHRDLSPVRYAFREASDEPEDLYSSAELPLLALPEFDREWTIAEIESLVAGYAAAMAAARGPTDRVLVNALAAYGRNFELLVEVTVPVEDAFSLRLTEDAPLGMARGTRVRQPLPLGDAASVHIEARTEDHTVKFSRAPLLKDAAGDKISPAKVFTSWRFTPETVSLYATGARDPLDLTIRLRSAPLLLATTIALIALDVAAAVAVLAAPQDDELYVERLAVLVVPTTFAATVVLAREQSALSAQLQQVPRLFLLLTLVALWTVTIVQVLRFTPPP